jgi:ABC-type polysaccharide/polyol phosphate transport system ATPase subunit
MKLAISAKSVSKKYPVQSKYQAGRHGNAGDFWALDEVSLDIPTGKVFGLIGRNGAGKSTFLNIAAGVISPTKGVCSVSGRVVSLFSLGVGFQDELTGRENIFLNGTLLGATKDEIRGRLDNIIGFSELGDFIDMPLGTYSQGMRLRLGFSVIANLYFDILLIDEVLAVGDTLFQNKCFEKLIEFKRSGKTIVLTSQSMDLIERLCDEVGVLNHGRLLFNGEPATAIGKYHALMNSERFFVGLAPNDADLVQNTKKWAEDISCWGRKLGTKDVVIGSVKFIDKSGQICKTIKSGDPLKVKVEFTVKEEVKEPHYGVALFREDGVYCYGPNTAFDGHFIPGLRKGKGNFLLHCDELLLAPGKYRISVAIWDRKEVIAFDYHDACYELAVSAYDNRNNELLNMPYKLKSSRIIDRVWFMKPRKALAQDLSFPDDSWGKKREAEWVDIRSVRLLNSNGENSEVFVTDELATVMVSLSARLKKKLSLWIGFFRDDGIYCQGLSVPMGKRNDFGIEFPSLPLLPGNYFLSLGVWDESINKFAMSHHGLYPFRMVSARKDHGTVYLKHRWEFNNE